MKIHNGILEHGAIARWCMNCSVFVLALLVIFPATAHAFFGASEETVTANANGLIVIEAEHITDKARFFTTQAGGKTVRFFAVRDTEHNIRVALDACDSCWSAGKGYEQQGDNLVCRLCGMKFHVNQIGVRKGGCNPHPILYKVDAEQLLIPNSEMEAGARFFR